MPTSPKASDAAVVLVARFGPYPFTLRQSEALGVSRKELRQAVEQGSIDHLRHDCYAATGSSVTDRADYLSRVAAALSRRWNAAGSHESAAAALGLPNPRPTPWRSRLVVVSNPGTRTRQRRGILNLDIPRDPDHEIRTPWGPVTGMTRTAYELAASRTLDEALVVADAVAERLRPDLSRAQLRSEDHREWARAQLVADAARWADPDNHARAMSVLQRADPAAESPAESRSRAVVIRAGLPPPTVGGLIHGAEGQTYYGDLVWEEQWVVAEVDGLTKYTHGEVLLAEKAREDSLRRAGWTVVRWTGREASDSPGVITQRLTSALR